MSGAEGEDASQEMGTADPVVPGDQQDPGVDEDQAQGPMEQVFGYGLKNVTQGEIMLQPTDAPTRKDFARCTALTSELKEKELLYTYCGDHYSSRYFAFTLPNILLTTSATICAVALPEEDWKGTVLAVLTGLATMLTSILTMYGYAGKKDVYYGNAMQLRQCRSKMDFLGSFHLDGKYDRAGVCTLLEQVQETVDGINSATPPVPMKLKEKFQNNAFLKTELVKLKAKKHRAKLQAQAAPHPSSTRASQVAPAPTTTTGAPTTGKTVPPSSTGAPTQPMAPTTAAPTTPGTTAADAGSAESSGAKIDGSQSDELLT